MEDLLVHLGLDQARLVRIEPTGVEKVGTWINQLSSILLILGIVGIYLEFKTPGFGIPGIVGLVAFAIYFLGGYVAGLSGMGGHLCAGTDLDDCGIVLLARDTCFWTVGAGLVLVPLDGNGGYGSDPSSLAIQCFPTADPIKVLTC